MLTTELIIEEINDIKSLVEEKYKSQIIGVFGSYARKQNSKNSDIDILVRFKKDATLFDWIRISDFIEERLKIKADVVSENSIKPEFKNSIYKDLILI